jgi:PAS domain S-box-containing protein
MKTYARDYFPEIANHLEKETVSLNRDQNYGIFLTTLETGPKKWSFWFGFSLKEVSERRKEIIFLIAVVSLSALVMLGVILYFAIKYFTKPIQELTVSAEAIGKGDLTRRVKIGSKDELGRLAHSFNKMTEDLQRTTVSKDYVDNIIGSMRDVLIVVDSDMKIRTVNKATCELLGYKEKEIIGEPVEIIFAETEILLKEKKLEKLIEEGEVKNFETSFRTKDSRNIPVLFSSSVMKDKDGKMIRLVCTGRDITERKQTEGALLNAAQQWRTTFDGISDMVCLLDPEGRILRCNKAMANLLGKPFSEIIGRTHWEIVYGTTAPIQECPVMRMRETHRRQTAILPINDRWFNIAVDPLLDETSGLIGAVHIMSDITERKLAEEALQRSEEKYRTILENIEEGYYEVDITGNFTFFNDSICRIWGYPKEELIGMNDRQYTDQENAKKLFQTFNNVYTTGEPARGFGWEIIRKDGTKRYIEASVSLQKDSSDKPIGFRGIIRDITERKRAEEERLALQEQLRQSQKMEAIGQLAGGVAHDFNNLLTVIHGYSELILTNLDENSRLHQDVREIIHASERASSLTGQLLAFSRKQVLQPKVLYLNAHVSNMDKMLRRMIGENIELMTLLAKDLGRTKADPGQIEQVILNLAVNARDAMLNGGKLTIETANIELDENYARSHIGVTPGHYVMLSVSDTGVGIAREVKERIFEPFFTTKEKGKGTGLGLSTVFGIIQQSGGNIWVYSEPGLGTTFKIYLPRIEEDTESLKPSAVSTKSLQGSETILLVEDEEIVRKLACTILQKNGYKVLEAPNGEEALRIVQGQNGNPIHLLVTDVVMPGMSGRQLADHLERLRPEMKILYISGYTDNAIVHHGILDEGMNYIQKPFTIEGLARKVREVLDK